MTTIELVRHAEAVERGRWWGRPDRERPLTDAGRDQAGALCRELGRGDPPVALYSSPLARCVATLERLGKALDLDVLPDERLAEVTRAPVLDGGDAWVASAWLGGRALAFVDEVVRAHPGGRVVACSHGDVIPAAMAAIAGRYQLDLPDVRCPKGGWFTLTFQGGACAGAVLHPPPAA